jgi:hypothetical protein
VAPVGPAGPTGPVPFQFIGFEPLGHVVLLDTTSIAPFVVTHE